LTIGMAPCPEPRLGGFRVTDPAEWKPR